MLTAAPQTATPQAEAIDPRTAALDSWWAATVAMGPLSPAPRWELGPARDEARRAAEAALRRHGWPHPWRHGWLATLDDGGTLTLVDDPDFDREEP